MMDKNPTMECESWRSAMRMIGFDDCRPWMVLEFQRFSLGKSQLLCSPSEFMAKWNYPKTPKNSRQTLVHEVSLPIASLLVGLRRFTVGFFLRKRKDSSKKIHSRLIDVSSSGTANVSSYIVRNCRGSLDRSPAHNFAIKTWNNMYPKTKRGMYRAACCRQLQREEEEMFQTHRQKN
jgi:hypothetical protein